MSDPRVTYYVDPDEGVWRAEDFVDPEGDADAAIAEAVELIAHAVSWMYDPKMREKMFAWLERNEGRS